MSIYTSYGLTWKESSGGSNPTMQVTENNKTAGCGCGLGENKEWQDRYCCHWTNEAVDIGGISVTLLLFFGLFCFVLFQESRPAKILKNCERTDLAYKQYISHFFISHFLFVHFLRYKIIVL